MKGHVRSVKLELESGLGVTIPDTHCILSWIVKFACSTYYRYHIGADGRTARERVKGRKAPAPQAQFGEAVWWMPLTPDGNPGALEPRFYEGFFVLADE